jgi:hypothetical protein
VCDKLCALILANALSWEHAPAQWYRENAHACAWRAERSSDPLAKAAYKEMVRAWLILAIGVEELVRHPLHETRTEEQVLAA